MSPVPDDFEQLRRLLALKRHEQPPPGYFHGFSRQVIVRIQAGEMGDAAEASLWSFSGGSFLQRIWATLDARPALAGAFGVAVCGFFVVGAVLSDATANQPPSPPQVAASPWAPQPKEDPEFPSMAIVNYQPPKDSLFKAIDDAQTPPQQADFRLRRP